MLRYRNVTFVFLMSVERGKTNPAISHPTPPLLNHLECLRLHHAYYYLGPLRQQVAHSRLSPRLPLTLHLDSFNLSKKVGYKR